MNITMKDIVPVEFKVSASEEDRKAGKTLTVRFKVNFTKTSGETFQALAIGAQNIRWQAQLKGAISADKSLADVIKELPSEVEFGSPLFSTSRTRTVTVTKPVTDEDVKKYVEKLSPAQKLQQAIELMESNGMEIPDAMLEKLNELTDAEEMEAVAARLAE